MFEYNQSYFQTITIIFNYLAFFALNFTQKFQFQSVSSHHEASFVAFDSNPNLTSAHNWWKIFISTDKFEMHVVIEVNLESRLLLEGFSGSQKPNVECEPSTKPQG